MPIEIRELHIKANVNRESNGENTSPGSDSNTVTPAEEMVNTCVEKVLEILKEQHER